MKSIFSSLRPPQNKRQRLAWLSRRFFIGAAALVMGVASISLVQAPTAAMALEGPSDYAMRITAAQNMPFSVITDTYNVGSSDFTVETWLYPGFQGANPYRAF
jgi:hypothetical protein